MNREELISSAHSHIKALCSDISDRSVGSSGNRRATDYVKGELQRYGWSVGETPLEVMDWRSEGASLLCGPDSYEVFSSPYSLGCSVEGELAAAGSIEELESRDFSGKVVLLMGDVAREQIMPKNFVFYNPEAHRRIVSALEASGVQAIVCATGRNSGLAGGLYPFPMFEDGDFDIPSVYMKDTEGQKLKENAGQVVVLESKARRISQTACNVTGAKSGTAQSRIVITAHVDAKQATPGAIDNATGVTVLLLIARLLKAYVGRYSIELVAFNGEDYYSAPGQMAYIRQNQEAFSDILVNINIDGAGYREGGSVFSLFALPEEVNKAVQTVIGNHPHIEEGPAWYQGDHSIFLQQGRPAIAISSAWLIEHMESQDITHTPGDHPGIVSYERLAEIALAIQELIEELDR